MKRKKGSKIGASGDYAKFEIAVIKNLAKILKQPLKKTQQLVNTDEDLLKIISKAFDDKKTVKETAQALKEKLVKVTAKNPLSAFVELLSKLPKKKADENTGKVKLPLKMPATVTIGANKHKDTKSHNTRITVISGLNDSLIKQLRDQSETLNKWGKVLDQLKAELKTPGLSAGLKAGVRVDMYRVKQVISDTKKQISLIKKNIK